MRSKLSFFSLGALLFLAACGANDSATNTSGTDTAAAATTAATSDTTASASASSDPDPSDTIGADGYLPSTSDSKVADMIRKTLVGDILKADMNVIPADQRKFKYQGFDLNNDGKEEYFVTVPGSYFCGTGGCSAYLLDNDGKRINDFSVVDFPMYVAASVTDGWQDLIIRSDEKFRYIKRNGGRYPSNPSTAEVFKGDPPNMAPQILDVFEGAYPAFSF